MTAKEKRKAIEEETKKQHILNHNKWDLVRMRREEMLKYQRFLRFKISLVRKMITNITLNRQMRVLFSSFEKRKKKRRQEQEVVLAVHLVAKVLVRKLRKKGPNYDERQRRQFRNALNSVATTVLEPVEKQSS